MVPDRLIKIRYHTHKIIRLVNLRGTNIGKWNVMISIKNLFYTYIFMNISVYFSLSLKTVDIESDSRTITAAMGEDRGKLSIIQNHIFVNVKVADGTNLVFLVDTGWIKSSILSKHAKRLIVQLGSANSINDGKSQFTGSSIPDTGEITLPLMVTGNQKFERFNLRVSDSFDKMFSFECDGVLGIDYLERHPAFFDLSSGTITFVPIKSDGNADFTKLKLYNPKVLNIEYEGKQVFVISRIINSNPIRFIFDSGAPGSMLRSIDVQSLKLDKHESISFSTVHGQRDGYRTGFVKISVHGTDLECAPSVTTGIDEFGASLMGLDIIHGGSFYIDLKQKLLVIDPLPYVVCGDSEFTWVGTGRLKITYVTKNSRTAKLGLKVGDEILQIDGQPVTKTNFIEPLSKVEDGKLRTLKLTILPNGETNLKLIDIGREVGT